MMQFPIEYVVINCCSSWGNALTVSMIGFLSHVHARRRPPAQYYHLKQPYTNKRRLTTLTYVTVAQFLVDVKKLHVYVSIIV